MLFLVLIVVQLFVLPNFTQPQVTEVSYSEFLQMVEDGQVTEVAVNETDQQINFLVKKEAGAEEENYTATTFPDDMLIDWLQNAETREG